ncbi:efflux transporter, outer membrane factor (OMF) lipoprotein, NodT family [Maridesulfovibrio ferrireducens]|uniref:Efflux transporter, outer membrane factor (OMF) lipoprotein, NodT family n=1 Tax=Maridesulfovibrio ferrireducens TaxID=246191 RepID=A0A1G9JHC3_9BACT|nr:efflux transporter outer membrane subunit [Maridesulfovibrio ferrireducens]SDL36858.1 efflux transporter, outer membrane factor (OMF) lipoprotein, NodT family [Maridesulfovibrio ferrireducens]
MRNMVIYICLIPFLLSGCGSFLQTEYIPPEVTIPKSWNSTGNSTSEISLSAAKWAESFEDASLTKLVKLVLERNNDLAAAGFRVRQAQLQAGLAYNDMLPQLSGAVGGVNTKYFDKSGFANSYVGGFNISYEADLWGKLSRTRDAAMWEAVASNEDRMSTALSLVGTTMKLYWSIAYSNVRIDLCRSNIQSSEKTLKRILAQQRYGSASKLEVNKAKQELTIQQAKYYSYMQKRQENISSLTILFDLPPGKIMADPKNLIRSTLPVIPAGLPVELLSRRPDLRAAESRLRKLLANTDAAKASFYPTLSLTGSLGGSSAELANMLDNPFAALASGIAFPFLNLYKLELNLDQSTAEYDEAVVSFKQTLYEAMKEVGDSLSNRKNLADKCKYLMENLEAARKVENIYEVRYRSGSGTFKDWMDAQDTRRTAEESLAENVYAQLLNYVNLYQALGGNPDQYNPVKKGNPA